MFKKILTFSIVLCLVVSSSSQKVKLKDLDVKVNYIKFPKIGFAPDVNGYNVKVNIEEHSFSDLGLTKSGIRYDIVIPGYIKFDENVGPTVDVTMNTPKGQPGRLVTTDKQDKTGKKWQEFNYDVDIACSALVKVIGTDNKLIKEYAVPYSGRVSTGTYVNRADAEKDFKNNSVALYTNGRTTAVREIVKSIRSSLQWDFGLDKETDKVELKSLKEKEHPEFAAYESLEKTVKEAYAKMTYEDNSNFNMAIKPALEFWTSREATYDGTDKEQKKLKYLCQMNLAQTYYWMDDFENASKYAQMVANGTEDQKDGKKYLEKIEKALAELKRVGRNSRHFAIKVSEAESNKQASALEEQKALIAKGDIQAFPDFDSKMFIGPTSKVEKGIYEHQTGKIDTGYFAFESNTKYPNFKNPKGIRFGHLKNGSIEVGTPNYSRTKAFTIGDIRYAVVEDIKIGAGIGSMKLPFGLVETIQDYKRTALVIIYPTSDTSPLVSGNNGYMEPDFFVFNKETSKFMPIDGLLGPSKALIKIVEGCDVAEQYAEANKEANKQKSIWDRMTATANIDVIKEALVKFDSCVK